ncbi:glycosyltransferase family 4 protein [Acetobacteraceae bacterium KSS8]|uniref:Glycosyltransferase family 4 protein n=1 Tax=Endosaccharibacter trunci TaxID=2812733 RepID=A0ABT1W8N0_9PROT|nr:glycosyltransferase family 4 protein [Acetobacteraceae bacterium KSS8]
MPAEIGPNRIWVDVEDLFQYAAGSTRPSGIQRVVFELCRALQAQAADRIGFLRHDPARNGFVSVAFEQIDALHRRLTAPAAIAAPNPATRRDDSADGAAAPGTMRRLAYRLPLEIRTPAVRLLKAQKDGLASAAHLALAAGRLGAARLRRSRHRAEPAGRPETGPPALRFDRDARAGDVLLAPGSPWFHPFYAAMVAEARQTHGLRVSVLFHDVIPLIRPEWCQRNLVARFGHWLNTLLPLVDLPLAVSRSTARDLERYASRQAIPLLHAPQAIPLGTGFSKPGQNAAAVPTASRRLPAPDSYVLIVSTLEVRKNHILLFRVWRRLLDEMPAEQVPSLVFAGRIGWLVEDLVGQLRNTDWLGGKIVFVEDPDDGELEQLYRGCRFTVFPSFYEGWGLPVTESLGFGRPCLASNSSALPEAGGALARYFDPEDGNAAFREIRRAIEDEAGTRDWAAEVERAFRPVGWDETVRELLEALM